MFLDSRELKFELEEREEERGGKPKTVCMVMNINTIVTTFEEDHHQSVQALATELKIRWVLYACATPPPFAHHSQELMFGKGSALLMLQNQLYLGFYLKPCSHL